jgi:hypothetical protein
MGGEIVNMDANVWPRGRNGPAKFFMWDDVHDREDHEDHADGRSHEEAQVDDIRILTRALGMPYNGAGEARANLVEVWDDMISCFRTRAVEAHLDSDEEPEDVEV